MLSRLAISALVVAIFVIPRLVAQQNTSAIDTERKSDELPSARKILERYLLAIGGYESLGSVSSFHCKMSVVSVEDPSTSYMYEGLMKNDACFEEYIGSNGRRTTRVVKDGEGWETMHGRNRKYSDAEVECFVRTFLGRKNSLAWHKTCSTFKCVGRETVRQREAYLVELIYKDGLKSRKYFDVESGLLVRSVDERIEKGSQREATCEIYEYKEFQGQLIPYRQKMTFHYGAFEYVVDSCEFNIELADDFFEFPEESRKVPKRVAAKPGDSE